MHLLALVLIPAVLSPFVYFLRNRTLALGTLVAVAFAHLFGVAAIWVRGWEHTPGYGMYLGVDAIGLVFLTLVSVVFTACAVAGVAYLHGGHGPNPNHYAGFLLFFLASMTAATATLHLGMFWVAVEATTLGSAPLIYAQKSKNSLEATWKYLVLCSVGIALALLGTLFIATVSVGMNLGHEHDPLYLPSILDHLQTHSVDRIWLKLAFILLLVGYGCKMGLAPLHNWLPDAHSEAPSPVSALLSGALLNCAFLGILRGVQICMAAHEFSFARDALIVLGCLSIWTGAVFMYRQSDFKRMLGYSSVENMGLLALGVGAGGSGGLGTVLQAVNHSFAKALLFLTAGNILVAFHSKKVFDVQGLAKKQPVIAFFWLMGFLAISGLPPFGVFFSKVLILRGLVEGGRFIVLAVVLFGLIIVFVNMSRIILGMLAADPSLIQEGLKENGAAAADSHSHGHGHGHDDDSAPEPSWVGWCRFAPTGVLLALSLLFGLYIPASSFAVIEQAGRTISLPNDAPVADSDMVLRLKAPGRPTEQPADASDVLHGTTTSRVTRVPGQVVAPAGDPS